MNIFDYCAAVGGVNTYFSASTPAKKFLCIMPKYLSILKGLDYDVGYFANDRCVETPRTWFILAVAGVTSFDGLNSRKFEGVLDTCKSEICNRLIDSEHGWEVVIES
jgi:hypothetical protein